MFLIVNADDYAYSPGISRGILDAARDGVVTATGVMATAPDFEEHAARLADAPGLDVGVHLNLTHGRPLTSRMRDRLAAWNRESFVRKAGTARRILTGRLSVDDVEEEWSAQVERCRDAGLQVRFLNSHEHMHTLPPLAKLVRRLADNLHVPYVRRLSPEWSESRTPAAIARSSVAHSLEWVNRRGGGTPAPELLGLSRSGRLDLSFVERRIRRLRAGRVYELMCHPGYYVPGEIDDEYVLSYHDWEGELAMLRSEEMRDLLTANGVQLVGYRDLVPWSLPLAARPREGR